MVENFERILKREFHREDLKALTSQIKEKESLLRLKRRWLMDLPLSTREQKKIEEILPLNDKILPEYFLREDDVSCEDIRTCVEIAFGAHNRGKEKTVSNLEDVGVLYSRDALQEIFLVLDTMTNKGLYSFVKILTGGAITCEKTKWSMKRTIKLLLPEVIAEKTRISETKLKQLFQLLQDPQSFCSIQTVLSTAPEPYSAAVIKVLDGLADFPSRALMAMQRKLRDVRDYVPSMNFSKPGFIRDNLILQVKKKCMNLLSEISEEGEPSERLSGALGVAGLTLRLMMTRPAVRDFRIFSPEIEALQNDILKAIHLLNEGKRVSLKDLKKVQMLLDPNSKVSVKSLRKAIRNLLTEYLYECSDINKIPDNLVEILNVINRRSHLQSRKKLSSSEVHSPPKKFMEEVIQKEVECVLTLSAQAKEVVSNLLVEHKFDEEFALAYMEEYVESGSFFSDDGDKERDTFRHFEFHSDNSYVQEESIGETKPVELHSPVSMSKRESYSPVSPVGRSNLHTESHSDKTDIVLRSASCVEFKVLDSENMAEKQNLSKCSGDQGIAFSDFVKITTTQNLSHQFHSPKTEYPDFPVDNTNVLSQKSRPVNNYLDVQEACDATSIIAYQVVGLVLDKLAKTECLELYQGDRLYLNSYFSAPEDSEEHKHALLASKLPELWKDVLRR